MDPKKLIADLEEKASAAGLSVEQLCMRAAISRATWQRIKSGKTQPSFPTHSRLQSLMQEIAAGTVRKTESAA